MANQLNIGQAIIQMGNNLVRAIAELRKAVRPTSAEIVSGAIEDKPTVEQALGFLNEVKATVSTGTWVPHIYDSDTKVAELTEQTWYKIGDVYFLPISVSSFPTVSISTMLQIRNAPCKVYGGNAYLANITGQLGDRTIQSASSGRAYFRPNVTGSISGGAFTALLIGI